MGNLRWMLDIFFPFLIITLVFNLALMRAQIFSLWGHELWVCKKYLWGNCLGGILLLDFDCGLLLQPLPCVLTLSPPISTINDKKVFCNWCKLVVIFQVTPNLYGNLVANTAAGIAGGTGVMPGGTAIHAFLFLRIYVFSVSYIFSRSRGVFWILLVMAIWQLITWTSQCNEV